MFRPCCCGGNNKLSPAYNLRGASFILPNLLSDPTADYERNINMRNYYLLPKQNLFMLLLAVLFCTVAPIVRATEVTYYKFPAIEGGTISTEQWAGKPYLVVNTASRCAFTKQYADLQRLYDKYRNEGFGIIAVPSDDFRQELDSDAEIKNFCELNYDIDMPMTSSLSVKGPDAHPFFKAMSEQADYAPEWNFYKILIGVNGQVVGSWGSKAKPMAGKITKAIESELAKSR